ncbi:MAG: hypothetical protein WED00_08850 [Aquisalimonadaceae bacterium]
MTGRPDFIGTGEPARLIPVVADTNKEQRAASIFLAALRSVFEFRKAMLGSLSIRVGSRATLDAWTEITFHQDKNAKAEKKKQDRPDGLLILNTGKKQWRALIEAKIDNAEIDETQLKEYIQQAKQHKIDAVITISNQFVALPTHHPIKLPKNLTKGVDLYHWSWSYIRTQASLLTEDGAIESPDQRFIIDEVLRYLAHKTSGIAGFSSMNREWKDVVGKVKSKSTLSKGSEEVENTVSSWHQEQRDLCLILSRKLAQPVSLKLSRAHRTDPVKRLHDDAENLVRDKTLICKLEIPNAAADLVVTADLSTRTIFCGMWLAAPQDKKSTSARVHWLTRQLAKTNPQNMYIKAFRKGHAEDTQKPLSEVLEDASVLDATNSNSAPTGFEVFYMVDLAGKFSGNQVFIRELEEAVPHFYEQAGERLRAWVAPPPKMKRKESAGTSGKDESERREVIGIDDTDLNRPGLGGTSNS